MLSALIQSRLRYPAVHLAVQPVNQWSVQHGPLVLVSEPLKYPTPTIDRDRTVSRRSEPSSRATLMGEQPNPWDLLQPQDGSAAARPSMAAPAAATAEPVRKSRRERAPAPVVFSAMARPPFRLGQRWRRHRSLRRHLRRSASPRRQSSRCRRQFPPARARRPRPASPRPS